MDGKASRVGHVRLPEWRWTGPAVVACLAVLASFARVASDWDWLIAVGNHVRSTDTIADHVPFAVAPTEGWHNVPVLAELVASLVDDLGGATATVTLHMVLVALTLLVLTASARHLGASDVRTALLVAVVCVGALPALALVRLQTFSLVLFAVLVSLLWHQARRPDARVWWVPVLVAVWTNLHGAALLGVCVAGAYLLLDRLRPRPVETVAVGLATILALLVTPQGAGTVGYYASVLDNEAAARGEGLWARPDPSQPFDVLMVAAVAVLVLVAFRRRRAVWEYAACLGLAVATAEAARHGVWLLLVLFMVAAVPSARIGSAAAGAEDAGAPLGRWATRPAALTAAVAAVVLGPLVLARGDSVHAVDPVVVEEVAAEVGDGVVLAPAPLVESLAAAGVTVWAGNPLDAFEPAAQRAYLDFLSGRPGMRPAVEGADVVVVVAGSAGDDGLRDLVGSFDRRELPGEYVAFVRP